MKAAPKIAARFVSALSTLRGIEGFGVKKPKPVQKKDTQAKYEDDDITAQRVFS